MQVTAKEFYERLVNGYKLVGQKGSISFTLKDLTVQIESKDTVGNLLQDWLTTWMDQEGIDFEVNPNSQKFPDIYLNRGDRKKGLLEVKSFDWKRGAGFDLANFESYCNSLLTDAYRLDSDYLIMAYEMNKTEIVIKDVWLKRIWEISGPSSPYPVKVQEKKKVIYNLRPVSWYSERSKFRPFTSKEEFLHALNETRYQYSKTHHDNSHWLRSVLKNYQEHTGNLLDVRGTH